MKIKIEFDKEPCGILAKVSLVSKAGEPIEENILAAIEVPLSLREGKSVQRLFPSTQEALTWSQNTVTKIQRFIQSLREDLPDPWEIDF